MGRRIWGNSDDYFRAKSTAAFYKCVAVAWFLDSATIALLKISANLFKEPFLNVLIVNFDALL